MQLAELYIVLADISGYTAFTRAHTVSRLHAEKLVSDLLEEVIARTRLPLRVNKLEGDAVLAYAPAAEVEAAGPSAMAQLPETMAAFLARRDELVFCRVCTCTACRSMGDLRLKAFIHRGPAVIKSVGRFEEIGGESVILAHRLMKNTVEAPEYLLLTAEARDALPPPPRFREERRTETVEGFGPLPVSVLHPPRERASPALSRPQAKLRGWAHAGHLDAYMLRRAFGAQPARPALPEPR